MNFWPFPFIRNYKTNANVTSVFERFLNSAELCVTSTTPFRVTVQCELGVMSFWTENKFYAYAQEGSVVASNGKRFEWKAGMPSRLMVKRMHDRLQKLAPDLTIEQLFEPAK